MSFPLVINSTHQVSNNTYKVPLASNTDLNDYNVAIGSGFVYYSWYNISAAQGNNSFQLIIPNAGTTTTVTYTIPDGAYNISTLQSWLEQQLVSGGYYLRYAGDASNVTTGAVRQPNIYPCRFQVNPATYSVQFVAISLPRTADLVAPIFNGYVTGGFTLPISANKSAQLVVSSTNTFGSIIGYAAGTFGSGTASSTEYTESTLIPNVNPISSCEMRLSCVNNFISQNSQLLHVFTNGGVRLGDLIDISPNQLQYIPCIGQHRELNLTFYDQTGKVLNMLDSNIVIKLVFKRKDINIE